MLWNLSIISNDGKAHKSFMITLGQQIGTTSGVPTVCNLKYSLHNSDCLEKPQDLEHPEGLDDPQHPAAAATGPTNPLVAEILTFLGRKKGSSKLRQEASTCT